MRFPPHLSRASAFPVTVAIGLLALAATVGYWLGRDIGPFLTDRSTFFAEPWRLVSSVFPHGDPLHLLFNLYWLWVFGSLIEERLGSLALLGSCVFFAVGSGAAEYAVSTGGIGLSGVGYGLFGMLYGLRRDPRFAGAVDARTTAGFVVWFFLCIVMTRAGLWRIANTAHAAGAALGLALGVALAPPAAQRRGGLTARWLGACCAVLLTAASLSAATRLRPYVNFSEDAGLEEGQLGYAALAENRNGDAVADFERAVRLSPKEPSLWHNLGVAYHRTGKLSEAARAFREAARLEPGNATYAAASRDFGELRAATSR